MKTRHSWQPYTLKRCLITGYRIGQARNCKICRVCGLLYRKSGMNVWYYTLDGVRTANRGCLERFTRFTVDCTDFVSVAVLQPDKIHEAVVWVEENFSGKWNLKMSITRPGPMAKHHFEFRFECVGEAGVFRMAGF